MKTVLITGCSSGYGLETALYFHRQGWRVIATMRNPREAILPASDRIVLQALDVTDPTSIADCATAIGPVDVLVNNAGIGLVGAFEATPMFQIRKIFDTNTLGVMAVTQAFLPALRARGGGVIVNVTSSATLAPSPYAGAYTASKMAIEGLSACLALELAPFDIRVKLVEPGHAPTTRFAANADFRIEDMIPEAYEQHARPIFEAFAQPALTTREVEVAEAVWIAAHDVTSRLQFPAGADAVALWEKAQ